MTLFHFYSFFVVIRNEHDNAQVPLTQFNPQRTVIDGNAVKSITNVTAKSQTFPVLASKIKILGNAKAEMEKLFSSSPGYVKLVLPSCWKWDRQAFIHFNSRENMIYFTNFYSNKAMVRGGKYIMLTLTLTLILTPNPINPNPNYR